MTRFLGVFLGVILPAVVAYALFISFGYLAVPVKKAPYELKQQVEQFDGYYKLKPGSYYNEPYRSAYAVNRDGFRHVPLADTCRTFEVMALGESSTIGLEVSDEHAWPAKLVSMGFARCVINAGIGGSTSSNHLSLLRKEFDGKLPKLLIYYAGRNDHGLGFGTEYYPGPTLWPGGFGDWFRHFLIFKKVQLRAMQFRLFGTELVDWFPQAGNWLGKYKSNLEQIIAFCRSNKGRLVIVQQLMPFSRDVAARINAGKFDEARSMVVFSEPAWPELLRQIDLYEAQQALAATHGIPFLRTLDDLPDNRAVLFNDVVHLTEPGHRYLAEKIVAGLKAP